MEEISEEKWIYKLDTNNAFNKKSRDSEDNKKDPYTHQEGGSHYKKLFPAFDLFKFLTINNVPFAEGQVTKHVLRHKEKNGVEDLKKAMHEIRMIAWSCYKIEL